MEYAGNSLDSKETSWHILKKYTGSQAALREVRAESPAAPCQSDLDYTPLRGITIRYTQKLITSLERGHRTALCVGH